MASTHMTTLRDILFKAESAANETDAHTEVAKAEPSLSDLDPLLDFRQGVPVEQIHLIRSVASASPYEITNRQPPGTASASARTVSEQPLLYTRTRRRRIVVTSSTQTGGWRTADSHRRPVTIVPAKPPRLNQLLWYRFIEAEERAYWSSIGGKPGTAREKPGSMGARSTNLRALGCCHAQHAGEAGESRTGKFATGHF